MPANHKLTSIHIALENREVTDELRRFIRAKFRGHGNRHCRIEDQTDEAFQNVSVRALERSSNFDPTRGSAVVWLKSIAKRLIIDEYRREPKFKLVQLVHEELVEEPNQAQKSTENPIVPNSLKIRDVIASLPRRSQEVFKFSYEEGMKGEELARALGCHTTGAARVLDFRFRESFTAAWARVAI